VRLFQEFPAKTFKTGERQTLPYCFPIAGFLLLSVLKPEGGLSPVRSVHDLNASFYAGIIQLYDDRCSGGLFYQRYFYRAAAEQIHWKKFRAEKSRIGLRKSPVSCPFSAGKRIPMI